MSPHDPVRDPTRYDGLYQPRAQRLPRPDMRVHRHTCPNGTEVVVTSQRIKVTGVTLDRWSIAGIDVGTSARATPNEQPPDFAWCDRAAGEPVPF
ncbi:hypothetical protein [Saccharothrix sp. HUAS TT1]|uniref:hypothetical protein n=1 Tax=unclassified Saccharothrix TaxID=2593673 RepID=UPI00345BA9F8